MAKPVKAGEKTIVIAVAGTDFAFNVDRKSYNDYQNSLFNNKNKVAGANNFLVSVVEAEQRPALVEFIEQTPGSELELVGALVEEYAPDISATVKK